MDKTPYKESYILQLEKLSSIIEDTNSRIISDPPDSLIYDNANFFTKAFLITMCAYLESYLKDSLMTIVDDTNAKLVSAKLPHNLILWGLGAKKDIKETDLKFKSLKLEIKKKDLDDSISGNPFKTRDLFKKFGIELEKNSEFNIQKEAINSIVVKRNKILHHNDEASDVSNKDLTENIIALKKYIINIDELICKHLD
ncbi:HEPN domain-containing protein [Flavobacterium xueshanense]|uniref:RiboL-PSP-HEPN domain-containing protein n=1 Tax=Flavobacterium xueshanense TaxID=935223 RepID=A0A1I2EQ37_9FLAO|nr:HEPN domain-containing protein [Flavobacterium xueshanense]SFE94935.1 hypothetical protein SAMN04488131_10678 [Flavobacterium xueshanense]